MIARHWEAVRQALAADREREAGRSEMEETTFLPAAMEIVERPVSPTARMTTWVLLGGLLVTILWLSLGKVDVVASASGKIIPASNIQLVQPAEQGVVRRILVEDGQIVKKGQPLIVLDPTVSTAEATQAEKALETARLDAARGHAVLSALDGHGLHFVSPQKLPDDVTQMQIALARAQISQIEATIAAKVADTGAARAALAEAEVQAAKLKETLPLLDEQIAANEEMLAKGYVSKLRVIEMRRQRLASGRDRDAALQTARRARAQIEAAASTRDQARAEARANVLTDLNKAEAEAKLRAEELAKATLRSSLQVLRSPVDGTVSQLAVHTVGGVVEAAKPIMIVVPRGGRLVAEVRVFNRDAGGIRAGQPAAIKLEAYPFTRYGTVAGRIATISSDAVEDEHLGLVYVVYVDVTANAQDLQKRGIHISPGMAVTADIGTGRRSIMSYLLSPVQAMAHDAAREP
ncbi:HlyD family type I secretion periplasmic adaptor subunit [Sphingomonas sp.]|uniref:HlyD family type I secretion periplasmic adaptor subunit n=1 Tax=Sphingomonas sp. TaxID=28214 RepID=UPI0025FA508B|nr:HlyD family type I secretion periplasmic adaptor subunit [Sphingomonas sp.]